MIPVRALLVTFPLTLLTFAICLFLGILGVAGVSLFRGVHPNMTIAYRHIAAPSAVIVGVVVLTSSLVMEIRRYYQMKALVEIERASRS